MTDLEKSILDQAYNKEFGARPIKRYIQHNVETVLARKIIDGTLKPKNKYIVDYINNEIVVK